VPSRTSTPFSSSQRAVLLEEGVFGWWMAPDFRISFWRPLSSLTHVLDHLLWPRSSVLAHAHSMLWFAALLAVLGTLYRRFHTPWIAHLPLLLYASTMRADGCWAGRAHRPGPTASGGVRW
jgi:hypothetical protein